MANLKLVKVKIMTDKFTKWEHKEDRNPQISDIVTSITAQPPPPVVPELAIAVKISGFIFSASGNNVFAKWDSVTPASLLSPKSSALDHVSQDSYCKWLQSRMLSWFEDIEIDTFTKSTVGRLVDSYFKTENQVEDENASNVMSLDKQAEELAYEHMRETSSPARLACEGSSCNNASVEDFLGISSSGIFENLNPDKNRIYQELKRDSLFEMIMQKLVEKEVREFNPKRDSLIQMITLGGREQESETCSGTDLAEALLQNLLDVDRQSTSCPAKDSESVTAEKGDAEKGFKKLYLNLSNCSGTTESSLHSSSTPDIVVKMTDLDSTSDIVVKVADLDSSAVYTLNSEPTSHGATFSESSGPCTDTSFDESTRKVDSPKKPTASEELRKLQLELKKALGEIASLKAENSQLKDEGVRLRKVAMTETVSSTPSNLVPASTASVRAFPPVMYLIAAIILGLIIGKLLL